MSKKPTYKELELRVEELEKERLKNQRNFLEVIFTTTSGLIKKPQSFLKSILAATPDLLILKDLNSVYLAVNPAFCKFINKKEEDIIGKTDLDLFPKHEAEMYRRDDKRVIETLTQLVQDEEGTGDEGKRLMHVVKTPVIDENNECLGVLCSVRDMTEGRAEHENLESCVANLNEAQEIAHIGSWAWEMSSGDLTWSNEVYRIFGLKPQEFTATYDYFLNTVHPDDREIVRKKVEYAVYFQDPYTVDYRIILPNGMERTVFANGIVTYDEKNKPVKMAGTIQDITVQRKADEELKDKNETLQLLADFNEIASCLETARVIQGTLELIAEDLGYFHSSVALYEPENMRFQIIGAKHEGMPELKRGNCIDMKNTVLSEVVITKKPRYRADIATEKINYAVDMILIQEGVKSDFLIPLIHENVCIGTLNIASEAADGISVRHQNILALLAPDLALALMNSKLLKELKDREEKYRILFDSAGDAIFFHNLKGEFIEVNDVACKCLGYSREELLKMSLKEICSDKTPHEMSWNIKKLKDTGSIVFKREHLTKDKKAIPVEINSRLVRYDGCQAILAIARDTTERVKSEMEREKLICELKGAIDRVNTLRELLPICASCKKIRDDEGYWHQLEGYITKHTGTLFSHGMCPDCAKELYPEFNSEKYYKKDESE